MAGMDMLMESALKLLVSRIPQEHIDKLANVAQIAINLDGKLNGLAGEVVALRQELAQVATRQQELLILFQALVAHLQPKEHVDGQHGERSLDDAR